VKVAKTSVRAGFFLFKQNCSNMKPDQTLTEMSEQLKQYVKTTTEIVKLEILKRTVMMSSLLLLQLFIGLLLALFFAFSGLALGFYFSDILKNYAWGFGLLAACVGLILILVLFFAANQIKQRLQSRLLKQMYQDAF
jgi:Zn-dependent protease with chaperone function